MEPSNYICSSVDDCLVQARALQKKKRFSEAIEEYKRGLGYDPRNEGALEGIVSCNLELGNAKMALEALNTLVEINPHSRSLWTDKAYLHLLINENAQGISTLREVLKQHPKRILEWELLAIALIAEEEWEEAIHALKRALVLNPNSAVAWYNLAVCHLVFDDYVSAVEAADYAVALDPSLTVLADEWLEMARAEGVYEDYPSNDGIAAS